MPAYKAYTPRCRNRRHKSTPIWHRIRLVSDSGAVSAD